MAKLSRQTKEIIQTVLFLVVVAIIVTVYIIYPLNRIEVQMARVDIDDYNEDSLMANSPDFFINGGLSADTFYFEPDALIKLACLYINNDSAEGTFILLHDDGENRDSLLELSRFLYAQEYSIILYDQRASGLSNGKYHGDGYQEAVDLEELISTLEIRGQITHPLYTVGFGLGADAALLASLEEKRIDRVVAVNPYLTTKRMQNLYKERFDTYWFPFYRTIMWWWYKMNSSYAPPYREIKDIQSAACPTLLVIDDRFNDCEEVVKYKNISDGNLLEIEPLPEQSSELHDLIISFINK